MKVWIVTELFCSHGGDVKIQLMEAFDSFDKSREFMTSVLNERYEELKEDLKTEECVDINKGIYTTVAFLEVLLYYDGNAVGRYDYSYSIAEKEIK